MSHYDLFLFFFNHTATTEIYTYCHTLSLHDALPIFMTESAMPPPAEPKRVTRLIRFKEVQHRVGLGRSTIYRWMAEGKFPKPVQLGGYAVAWAQEDIDAWIGDKGTN